MKKMPCLFVREFHGRDSFTITEEVTPGCEWVLAGEGVASVKRDGTACMFKGGVLYKRYDAKKDRKTGEFRKPPEGAIPCSDPDPVTGHWPHWVPIGPHDKWHHEAFAVQRTTLVDGATYELCGPKLQGNPERCDLHVLLRHGAERVDDIPRNFYGLRGYLSVRLIEGLVFAHDDGRMAKIRRDDFGFPWPVEARMQEVTPNRGESK
jgi:hypothetical protein